MVVHPAFLPLRSKTKGVTRHKTQQAAKRDRSQQAIKNPESEARQRLSGLISNEVFSMSQTAEIYQFPGPPEQPAEQEQPRVVADVDKGFTKLADALLLKLCSTKLSDRESRILHAVMAKTYKFHKAMDWIANGQLSEMTGIVESHISEVKAALIKRKILLKDGHKIGVNPVVSEWEDKAKAAKNPKQGNTLNGVTKNPKQGTPYPKQGNSVPDSRAHNRKTTNTTDHITTDHSEADAIAVRVIDYLNASAGKRFKHTATNIKFIRARLKDGHAESDLITVIDSKVGQWKNDRRMNEYLRPSTLFNSEKFESYLNASAPVPNSFAQTDYTQGAEGFDNV